MHILETVTNGTASLVGLIRIGGRISYAAYAARRSNSAGLIWPSVECRRRWL
jgi:hypothetical protein